MALEFFISHSHKDKPLAAALAQFLISGVGVPGKEIRCTSELGMGLESGSDVSKQLRSDIKKCSYFLPLLTTNSVASEFVSFEIGAAWVLDKDIRPLVFGLDTSKVPSLLKGIVYRDISKQDQLVLLAQELSEEIFVKAARTTPTDILNAATTFLKFVAEPPEGAETP
jgi:hypothetical protein